MRYALLALAITAASASAFGQHLIVTAEGNHGAAPPELMKDEVTVEVDKRPAGIKEWVPLRGDEAKLDLYVVIDDGEDTDLGLQFQSLKAFMNHQPETTRIGLAYLRNGAAMIVAPLSTDHAAIAKAIRLPLGQPGISASPYMGISDLVKKWPTTERETGSAADFERYRSVVTARSAESISAEGDRRRAARGRCG